MSFSYDSNLSSTKDYLRFRLDDTVQSSAVFSDEEINGLVNRYGETDNGLMAGIQLAMRGYVKASKQAIDYGKGAHGVVSQITVDRRAIPQYWLNLAKMMREEVLWSIDEAVDSVAFDVDQYGIDRSDYVGRNWPWYPICNW